MFLDRDNKTKLVLASRKNMIQNSKKTQDSGPYLDPGPYEDSGP